MRINKIAFFISIVLLIIMSLIAAFPFYSMIIMGTYYANDLFTGIKLLPGDYLVENFKSIMSIDIGNNYKNSLIVATGVTLLGVLVSSMAGFAFAKYNFRMKKFLFAFILATMMVPKQLGLVAFIIEMRAIGWIDTLLPLIIPPAANAFGAFWMAQYSKSAIPHEVLESARIDGCSEYGLFFRIALPFLRSALVTIGLLLFLWSWNDFLTPFILLSDEKLFTLQLGIRQLSTQFRFDYAAQILGLTLGTIPILIFFAIFSKNLISGLSAAAVKG